MAIAGGASAQTQAPVAVHLDAAKVEKAIAMGGPLLGTSELILAGGHRDRAGMVEVHARETDILYMIKGEATFATGGEVIGARESSPGQILGTGLNGGTERVLKAGDIVVVPAGTPHWFKTVSPAIDYLIVKVLRP